MDSFFFFFLNWIEERKIDTLQRSYRRRSFGRGATISIGSEIKSGHEDIKNVETIVPLSRGNVPPPRGERRLLGDDFHRDDSGKKEAC